MPVMVSRQQATAAQKHGAMGARPALVTHNIQCTRQSARRERNDGHPREKSPNAVADSFEVVQQIQSARPGTSLFHHSLPNANVSEGPSINQQIRPSIRGSDTTITAIDPTDFSADGAEYPRHARNPRYTEAASLMVQSLSALQAPQSVLHTSIAHVSKPSAGNSHTHTQYVIRVSDERTAGLNWTVYRRYSEFRLFRLRLEEAVKQGDMCSHCSIMSKRTSFMQFPHRRLFWNTKEKVLESRRLGLNAFLDAVAKHARTCRESMTCQTRTLMDQFLDVNDMRYTYLNVNMSDSEDDYRNKLYLNSTTSSASSMATPNHLFSATPTRYGARSASYRELRSSSVTDNQVPEASDSATTNGMADSSKAEPQVPTFSSTLLSNNDAGRVLTGKASMPNLLEYGRTSRSSRTSFTEENRAGRLSDWETAKFQTTGAARHSDPGAHRNDLLNFANASGRRSDHRSRARKVHLSSAAKRVKKLEEQEARFSVQPPAKQKKVALPTIFEAVVEEDE